MKNLVNPPELRLVNNNNPSANNHRQATWLELFFDLIFVVAVARLSNVLSENFSTQGFLGFALIFLPVWWSWVNTTYYSDLFDTDDIIHRLLIASSMIIVSALAINIPHALDVSSTAFTLSYISMRGLLIIIFLRAGWHIAVARPLAVRVAQSFGLSMAIWGISILYPAPVNYILWLVGLAIEIGMSLTAGEAVHVELAPHTSHLPERFGLFTIIVLGESVLAVVQGAGEQQWSFSLTTMAILCFMIAFCLWWIYFDNLGGSAIQAARSYRSIGAYQAWVYAHLPLSLGLTSLGVAVNRILSQSLTEAPHPHTRWIFCFSVAMCFASLAIFHLAGLSHQAQLRCKSRAICRFGSAFIIAGLGLLGGNFTAFGLIGTVFGICGMQVVFDLQQKIRQHNPIS